MIKIRNFGLFYDMTAISGLVAASHIHSVPKSCPLRTKRITQGRLRPANWQKLAKISKSAHPSGPWTTPRHPGNQHQHQISISFQLPPPDSSTKLASASSFHHQASALNQHQLPVSTTRQQHHISQPSASHPASQLLTLLTCHTHIMADRSVV